jgi:hypothetical protein
MQAAIGAGLAGRVHAQVGDLSSWTPQVPLGAVIVNPAALHGLTAVERARIIEVLQSATMAGGVHLLQTVHGAGRLNGAVSLDELRSRYRGWTVSVERTDDRTRTFLARKGAA